MRHRPTSPKRVFQQSSLRLPVDVWAARVGVACTEVADMSSRAWAGLWQWLLCTKSPFDNDLLLIHIECFCNCLINVWTTTMDYLVEICQSFFNYRLVPSSMSVRTVFLTLTMSIFLMGKASIFCFSSCKSWLSASESETEVKQCLRLMFV